MKRSIFGAAIFIASTLHFGNLPLAGAQSIDELSPETALNQDYQADESGAIDDSEFYPGRPERPGRPGYPDRPGRPGRPDRPDRPNYPGPGPGDHQPYPPYPQPSMSYQIISCGSINYSYSECYFDPRNIYDVVLTRQLSRSACRYGDSYGIYADRVWVNRGCRAEFTIRRSGR